MHCCFSELYVQYKYVSVIIAGFKRQINSNIGILWLI